MKHSDAHKNTDHAFGCCSPMMMRRHQSCGLCFGIMLILIGTMWLAKKMDWFVPDLFWPVAFLSAGVAIVALVVVKGRKPRGNERQAKVV